MTTRTPASAKSSELRSETPSSPPVFIVGCPRSGTTLLRMMLDSHPQLAIPPESHFIPKVWAVRRRYERNGSLLVDRVAADIMHTDRYREWNLPEQYVWRRLHALTSPGIADIIETFFLAYMERESKQRWGDKTPGYSLDIPLIARLFPTARFIHLIRDGRDVATSLRDHFKDLRPSDAALAWATRVRKGRAQGGVLGADRYLEVHYEDLVADPAEELSSICEFIGLDYRSDMLEYSRRVPEAVPESEHLRIHSHLDKPPTSGLRNWRAQMTPSDLALFEALAGRELEQFGYRRAVPVLSSSARKHAAVALAAHGVRRAAWKTRARAIAALKQDELPPSRRW